MATTDKQFGGWYANPNQGGKSMRFWGGNTWTTGEDPTGGKGINWQSSAAPQSATGPTQAAATPSIDWETMVKGQGDARNAFTNTQATQSADLQNRYTNAIGGQETTSAMAGRIGTELGLPQLQKSAFDINQNLSAIPTTQTQATRGYDVNANQLQRIIGAKQAELAPAAQTATAQAQNAQNSLNTQMGYEQSDQAKQLLPFQMETQMLADRQAREATGFNTQQQNELTMLLRKIDSQQTLTTAETARAQQLADAETAWDHQKQLIALNKTASAGTGASSYLGTPGATTTFTPAPATNATTSPAAATGFVPDQATTATAPGKTQSQVNQELGYSNPIPVKPVTYNTPAQMAQPFNWLNDLFAKSRAISTSGGQLKQ